MPWPNVETSVSRIEALDEQQVWAIGQVVATKSQRTLYARGDIFALDVRRTGLDVLSEEPPPRHANIVRWPTEKSAQMLRAKELAKAAKLVLKP